jgi:tRNA threonylcarbamoyladenosine modification (KEOPS) complex Cgi121 subunit
MQILRLRASAEGEALGKALDALDAIALKPGMAVSIEEFRLAYHLAARSFAEKRNLARQLRYEFLLWLAGKTDIRSAMKEAAPEFQEGRACEIIVAVFSDSGEGPVCSMLGGKKLPLKLGKKAEPLALERISLSRIGK